MSLFSLRSARGKTARRARVSRFDALEDRRLLAILVGLTEDNSIRIFDSATPGTTVERDITGVQDDANIIGIDVRPANGELYGISDDSRIYIIEPTTGVATFVSALSTPLPEADAFGVDFNPVPDRLRVTSTDGTNYRINVDTGAVIVDSPLSYAPGDVNAGDTPELAGSAYTNSIAGATATTLYGIDTDNDVLVTQNPPNNGTLNTVGSLGVDADEEWVGFDIINPTTAGAALEIDGDTGLYAIDLVTGAATFIGEIGDGEELLGLAADPTAATPTTPPTNPPTTPNPSTPEEVANLNFVLNLYEDVLNREADPAGAAYWAGELNDDDLSREEVAQNFLASPEYVLGLIQSFYQTFLGRTATVSFDPASNQFVGVEAYFFNKYYGEEGDAEDRLDDADREEDIISEIVTSQEYLLVNGATAETYVTALYADILGRAPDAGGLAGFSQRLIAGASPASIVNEFVHSTELHIKLLSDELGALPYIEDWNDDYFDGLGSINDPAAQEAFEALEDGDTWRSVQAQLLATDAYFAVSQTLLMT